MSETRGRAERWTDLERFHARLRPYLAVCDAYVDRRVTGVELGVVFFALFKRETELFPEAVYDALQEIFGALDAYEPDEDLRARTKHTIDEAELRQVVEASLAKLVSDDGSWS